MAIPRGAVRVGALASGTRVALALVLRPRDAAALDAFIAATSTPGSRDYGHYLGRGAFASRFGPSAATLRWVRTTLRDDGLRVTSVSPSHLVVDVAGTAREVARLLDVSFTRYRLADGSSGYAAEGAATLPRDLAALVAGVAGTSDLAEEQPTALRAGRAIAVSRPLAAPRAGPTTCTTAQQALEEYQGTFSPAQEGQAYGLDTAWNDGDLGQGRSIALVEFAPYAMSDVLAYDHCFGLVPTNQSTDPNLRNVLVDGGTSPGSASASDEPTLDIEEARALAPDADVVVYEGPNNVLGPLDTLQRIATDDTSSIVSTSWGICEALSDHAAEAPVFAQLAAQGQTVYAAAGDSGSSDCYEESPASGPPLVGPAVDDPASQPLVTGVGGLTVTSLAPLRESVWNDCDDEGSPGCLGDASGGGASSYAARPSWQSAPGVPTGHELGAGRRDVPDLSVMGDPSTGMLAFYQNVFVPYGGTSMGAPLMAALDAVATNACGTSSFGFVNPLLYSMAGEAGAYNDVVSGNNAIAATTVAHHEYVAHAGYDLASGLGSPDATGFIDDLCGGLATATASPTTPSATSAWTFGFHAGASAYVAGTRVTIAAPPGTVLPGAASAWRVTTSEGTTEPSLVELRAGPGSSKDDVATLTLGGGAPAHSTISVSASGVTNPPLVGTAQVTITDSLDALAPVATLALSAATPSDVTLRVLGQTDTQTPLDAPGLELRALVTDASGDAIAGASLTVATTNGAVARLSATQTDDEGAVTLLARDDRTGDASVAVTADGTASGSVQLTFTDPWRASVVATRRVGEVTGNPSVATGLHGSFAALVRTANDRLCVVVGTARGASAVPLRTSRPVPALGSSPSLARVGGQLVAAYRSARGHLVVLWVSVRTPRAAWSAEDLTAAGVAPLLAGPPDVAAVGAGAAVTSSIAAVDAAHHVVVLRARLRSLARYAMLDVSKLARAPAALATPVAQAPVGGTMGYVVAARSGRLLLLARNGSQWLTDDLADDAMLYGPATRSTGDVTAAESAGMLAVVAPDAAGQLVLYVGTLGNWSATVLAPGPAGTSAPAGTHSLPALGGVPSLRAGAAVTFIVGLSRAHRLVEVTSQAVADPYASYDLSSLARFASTASGAAFVPSPKRALLCVVAGRLVLLGD